MSAGEGVVLSVFLLPEAIRESYVVAERHHACAVLATDFPHEWDDLIAVLTRFRLRHTDLVATGVGNKSLIARSINGHFADLGWEERPFDIRVTVDGETTLSPTHHVDYFKNRIAIETEWNNKDPFYDRDLTVFRLLHEYNVVSVGVVITRADDLQGLFNDLGRGKSYGPNTTHMGQLIPRIANRVGGGCPVLALGIKRALYVPA
jgi:hypothetical protein